MPFKRLVGHPGQRELQSTSGFYDNPGDPPGVFRHDLPLFESPWANIVVSPSVPLQTAYYVQWQFVNLNDKSTFIWAETITGDGSGLTLFPQKGGGVGYTTGAVDGDANVYSTTSEPVVLGDGNVWFEIIFTMPDGMVENGGYFEFGFADMDTWSNGASDDQVMFRIVEDDAGNTQIEVYAYNDGVNQNSQLFMNGNMNPLGTWDEVDLFDGNQHKVNFLFADTTILIYIDDKIAGQIHVVDDQPANQRAASGGPFIEVPDSSITMSVVFGTTILTDGEVDTIVGGIRLLEDE